MKAAVYVRVSSEGQRDATGNQRHDLELFAHARGWTATEYEDVASGAKESRPALDRLLDDARRRKFDVLIVWRLDRLSRNLGHLLRVLDELQALGVAFVSLNEGIDATTAAGRLQMHILGSLAEFERDRIRERVRAGIDRARREGKHLGRPRVQLPIAGLAATASMSLKDAARELGISRHQVKRWRGQARKISAAAA
jgi:DNA invertase Pin-like site-specific DNA recombinase